MRNYAKQSPPSEFHGWQEARSTWESFAHTPAVYGPTKESLLREQNYLCCYCESSITASHCHIDHFQPRNGLWGDPSRTFDYANLACSCNGGSGQNSHCGHYKGSQFDRARFINPSLENNSGRFYSYTPDGRISAALALQPRDSDRASYMIRILHLDCPRLSNMRRTHARCLMNTITAVLDDSEALDALRDFYLTPREDGQLESFFSLTRQLLGINSDPAGGVRGDKL